MISVGGLTRRRYVDRRVGREGKRLISGGYICMYMFEKERCVIESNRHDVEGQRDGRKIEGGVGRDRG